METTPSPHLPGAAPGLSEAKTLLEKLLNLMGIEAKIEQCSMDDTPLLHIETPDAGRLIGKFGQTLNDLQFLLNRMLYRQVACRSAEPTEESRPFRVIIDVERYRERQRDELLKHVFQTADQVRRWGDPVDLEPMNSFTRRIVHRAFANDPEIETVSNELEGENSTSTGRKRITLRLRQNQPPAPAAEEVTEE